MIGTYTPIPVEMRRRYEAYINSAEWRRRRRRAIERAGYHCEKCGVSAQEERLEVHHLTYERIGHERDEDLSVLCHACHAKADLERANNGQQKARSALWAKRLDGWATKVYGEDWQDYHDGDVVADEFERWLDSKGLE